MTIGIRPCPDDSTVPQSIRLRCFVSNYCGGVLSDEINYSICPADFNCSGSFEAQDIFGFLGAWFALDRGADFNGMSGVSTQDIFDFLASWFVGC
jgi:hypothetical protein